LLPFLLPLFDFFFFASGSSLMSFHHTNASGTRSLFPVYVCSEARSAFTQGDEIPLHSAQDCLRGVNAHTIRPRAPWVVRCTHDSPRRVVRYTHDSPRRVVRYTHDSPRRVVRYTHDCAFSAQCTGP
jgi:hypothetical protein